MCERLMKVREKPCLASDERGRALRLAVNRSFKSCQSSAWRCASGRVGRYGQANYGRSFIE